MITLANSRCQTYFQYAPKKECCRLVVTSEVLWNCNYIQNGGVVGRQQLRNLRQYWHKSGEIWKQWVYKHLQPEAFLWTPPCFNTSADVALIQGGWRVRLKGQQGASSLVDLFRHTWGCQTEVTWSTNRLYSCQMKISLFIGHYTVYKTESQEVSTCFAFFYMPDFVHAQWPIIFFFS